jgi:secondary thiamine-phosphate synthase enzyme
MPTGHSKSEAPLATPMQTGLSALDAGKSSAFDQCMAAHAEAFEVRTRGKGTFEISDEVAAIVGRSGIQTGTVTVFVRHTSASLVIMENADPSARRDLEVFFDKLVPEDTPWFVHTLEGPDDMPSHIRMALTRTSEVIPVMNGRMVLGTWQGIFLFEHRRAPHRREIVVSVVGE